MSPLPPVVSGLPWHSDRLIHIASAAAADCHLNLRQGNYAWTLGPSFETPAEIGLIRAAGGDAVGMSTVPEATVAHHGGTRVMGVSGISNKANLDGETETTHDEVLEAGNVLVPKLTTLIRGVLRKL